MAAISSISNGEALSSVRTKLNDVITEINLLDPTVWVDYSSTSTIVGWSSFTTKQIFYRIIGKQIFVVFNLAGTSNSTTTTFTLPSNSINVRANNASYSINNGSLTTISFTYTTLNSNVVTCMQNATTNWTSSGIKQVWGQFFYEIA